MTGPSNYVVASFRDRSVAEALARAITAYGMWAAEVRTDVSDEPYSYAVVLPGECVEGTKSYMHGFVEGFMYATEGHV